MPLRLSGVEWGVLCACRQGPGKRAPGTWLLCPGLTPTSFPLPLPPTVSSPPSPSLYFVLSLLPSLSFSSLLSSFSLHSFSLSLFSFLLPPLLSSLFSPLPSLSLPLSSPPLTPLPSLTFGKDKQEFWYRSSQVTLVSLAACRFCVSSVLAEGSSESGFKKSQGLLRRIPLVGPWSSSMRPSDGCHGSSGTSTGFPNSI